MSDPAREWIAQVCREHRERHGFKRSDVASDVGREGDSIRNFETLRGMWNPQTGAIVESYAKRSGTTSIKLWQAAIERWASAAEQPSPDMTDTDQPKRNLGKSAQAVRERHAKRPRSRKAQ